MKNLFDTIEDTKIPSKYELRPKGLESIYNGVHGDVFRMICWVFKIGFMGGWKAGPCKIIYSIQANVATALPQQRGKEEEKPPFQFGPMAKYIPPKTNKHFSGLEPRPTLQRIRGPCLCHPYL